MAEIDNRCKLCTANDMDAVIEQLAADLWESRRGGTFDDWPWAETSEFWKRTFRQFAETAVHSLHPTALRRDVDGDREER